MSVLIWVLHMHIELVTYNPLSLARAYRLEHIVHELSADILFLTGTGLKQLEGTYSTWPLNGHRVISWGYDGRQPYSNRSAGVAIVVGPRLAEAGIVDIAWPSSCIQGRAGTIRLKSPSIDITATVAYPPPIPTKAAEKAKALPAAKLTAQW